jgi:hypothetical protein
MAYLPVLAVLVATDRLNGAPLLYAITAGVLASVVPYAADLTALRYVPQQLFGVFMSVNPVIAALAGMVLLKQVLDLHEWAGILVVVAANAVAVTSAHKARPALRTIEPVQHPAPPSISITTAATGRSLLPGKGPLSRRGARRTPSRGDGLPDPGRESTALVDR